MGDNSLFKVGGEISKPLTVLIEKIAEATGILYEPTRTKRNARAQADQKILEAETHIRVEDIHRRALARWAVEETRKQENMENIIELALPLVSEDNKVEDISEDWIAQFFDKCRLVADKDMQSVWAKILAGEVNQVGTFSSLTVDTLSRMSKSDAELFSKLASICIEWEHSEEIGFTPHLITPLFDAYTWLGKHGISFDEISDMECLGLVLEKDHSWRFDNVPIVIKFKYFEEEWEQICLNQISLGTFMLTRTGAELFKVVTRCSNESLVDSLPFGVAPSKNAEA